MKVIEAFVLQTKEQVGHQKAYENKILLRHFWGVVSTFAVTILTKFMCQYRFSYTYREGVLYGGDVIIVIEVITGIATVFFWIMQLISDTRYDWAVNDGYDESDLHVFRKAIDIIGTKKYLNRKKFWYYASELSECIFYGVLLAICPPVPVYLGYLTGSMVIFFAVLEGFYHRGKYGIFSDVGWTLSISSTSLLVANVFFKLDMFDNILGIVSIVGSFFVIMSITSEDDVWEKLQKNSPVFTLEEQENILEGYCYMRSRETISHSRNIIFQLVRLFMSDD